jgi:hypothetical protein
MKTVTIDNKSFISNPENLLAGIYKIHGTSGYINVSMRVGCPNRLGIFNYDPEKDAGKEIQGEISLKFEEPLKREVFYCDANNKLHPVEVEFIKGIYRVVSNNYFLQPVYNFSYRKENELVEIPTDKYIKLKDGKYLINDYGKYQSGLSIINNIPLIEWIKKDAKDFNLPEGNIEVVYGNFFISKKGTKCFEIKDKENAKHILISDDWGGAFNSYRGRTLPQNGLYFKRASSNGGGAGVDYAILDKDWKHSLSVEDI